MSEITLWNLKTIFQEKIIDLLGQPNLNFSKRHTEFSLNILKTGGGADHGRATGERYYLLWWRELRESPFYFFIFEKEACFELEEVQFDFESSKLA